VSGNQAGVGGGIYGSPTITNSTISGNSGSPYGGGIYGSPIVTNSTITGNSASEGGGIYGGGIIRHCTITDNTGSGGGGGFSVNGSLEIANTILKTGALGPNVFDDGGTITSQGYNISSDDGG